MAWTVVRREAATMLKINKVAFLDLQLMFCKLAPVKHRNSPVEVFFFWRRKSAKATGASFLPKPTVE